MAYLADIFGHLNKLNLKLPGTELNLLIFQENVCGFIAKLQNLCQGDNLGSIAMFEKVSDLHESGIDSAEQFSRGC